MKNVDKITLYLPSNPAGQVGDMDTLKRALSESGPDAQANARRWVVLGMLSERAGFRAYNGTLVAPAGGGYSVPATPINPPASLAHAKTTPAEHVRPIVQESVQKEAVTPSPDRSLNDPGSQFPGLLANIRNL